MTLLINNDVVRRVLDMRDAITGIEDALRQLGEGLAVFQSRTDMWSPTSENGDFYRWGSLLGAMHDPPTLALRFKSDNLVWAEQDGRRTEGWFCIEPGTYCGFVLLFDTRNGELIAMMNDGVLQHERVGATAAVGVKYAARADASTLCVVGSGGMARSYTRAISLVRGLKHIRVYSPTEKHRAQFAEEMSAELGIEVEAVASMSAAVSDMEIVALCTDSMLPIYTADMIEPGVVVVPVRDEVEPEVYSRVDTVLANHGEATFDYILGSEADRARRPSNELARRKYSKRAWDRLLPDVICGRIRARDDDQQAILFRNNSFGVQFAAVGRIVYNRAQELGLGTALPSEWFLQTIRN